MTTTNFSLCIFCLCLLTSCSKGEKKTNEPVRVKAGKYRMLMILSLAPLRTKMAESEKFSGFYNRVKSGIYKVTGKGR